MKNKSNKDIIEKSIISVGKYEILFCSYSTLDDDNDRAIQYLNNARVVANAQLKYDITPSEDDEKNQIY